MFISQQDINLKRLIDTEGKNRKARKQIKDVVLTVCQQKSLEMTFYELLTDEEIEKPVLVRFRLTDANNY